MGILRREMIRLFVSSGMKTDINAASRDEDGPCFSHEAISLEQANFITDRLE